MEKPPQRSGFPDPGKRSLLQTISETDYNRLDEIARVVDGTFVVVVKISGNKYLGRCYFTARAAQAAVHRATSRGENATIYLAELRLVWKIQGGAR